MEKWQNASEHKCLGIALIFQQIKSRFDITVPGIENVRDVVKLTARQLLDLAENVLNDEVLWSQIPEKDFKKQLSDIVEASR